MITSRRSRERPVSRRSGITSRWRRETWSRPTPIPPTFTPRWGSRRPRRSPSASPGSSPGSRIITNTPERPWMHPGGAWCAAGIVLRQLGLEPVGQRETDDRIVLEAIEIALHLGLFRREIGLELRALGGRAGGVELHRGRALHEHAEVEAHAEAGGVRAEGAPAYAEVRHRGIETDVTRERDHLGRAVGVAVDGVGRLGHRRGQDLVLIVEVTRGHPEHAGEGMPVEVQ